MPKTAILVIAMVGPTGVDARIQIIVPTSAQPQEMQAEQIITFLKLLKIPSLKNLFYIF